jgi:hypothetical protein
MNTKQDARKLDLYGKEDLRRRVIQAVTIENVSVAQAARLFGVSRTRAFLFLLCDVSGIAKAV